MLVKKQFYQSKIINAPLDVVWKVIQNEDHLKVISTNAISGNSVENEEGISPIPSYQINREKNELVYSISDSSLLPIFNPKGKYQLKTVGEGKTEVLWSVQFDFDTENFLDIEGSMNDWYEKSMEDLQQLEPDDLN